MAASKTRDPMAPSQLLKLWLGAMYQSDVLKRGSYDDALRVARERVTADEVLRAEAEQLRTALRPVVKARPHSHVEAAQLRYLDAILAKET